MDGERLVEEVLLTVHQQQFHQVLGGPGIDLAAVLPWIDEGAQSHA